MKKNMCKGILGFIGMTSIGILGGYSAFAEGYTDSATSDVDILIREDPNVGENNVFKFDSVPTGFRFEGTLAQGKIAMKGKTEGNKNKIILKTDIKDADKGDFKVTGKMTEVSRHSDKMPFSVDSFVIRFGPKDVNVKDGTAPVLDKDSIGKLESSTFYHYIEGKEIAESTLTLAGSDKIKKGDEFEGKLTYTLSGNINFA